MKNIDNFLKYCYDNGFFYPSSEIYSSLSGFFDYGSYGTLIKRNFENLWRNYFGNLFDNIFELEPENIMHKNVFKASKHLELFNDPITECKKGHRFRADKLIEEQLKIKAESITIEEMNKIFKEGKIKCPVCNSELSEVKLFNLMFPIFIGPESDLFLYLENIKRKGNINDEDIKVLLKKYEELNSNTSYLRPETAQSVYVNFAREIIIHRNQLPLGLFIIGKAFRNEISPRNALIRMREFTQAELQIFFDYKNNIFDNEYEKVKNEKINILLGNRRDINKDFEELSLEEIRSISNLPKFYLYFLYKVFYFYINILNIDRNRIRFYQLIDNEKSFYNLYHFDLEVFLDELGWIEIGGIHFRTIKPDKEKLKEIDENIYNNFNEEFVGYDLWNHLLLSKNKNFILRRSDNSPFIPVELELSFGVDRNIFAILYLGYSIDEKRTWLKINKKLAPVKIAIFPLLSNNEKHLEIASKIYNELKNYYKCFYDDSGSIGRRYRRQDEIGTPFCITIDNQTLQDNTVTIRFIEDMKQIRLNINELKSFFDKELLNNNI